MEKTTPKTTVFNLIILDESGSMSHLTSQTISGCNETINVARVAARKHSDTLRSLLSIYAFQSGGPVPSRYIVKNISANDETTITARDYQPYGCTPLLDAVGSTLSELKAVAATHEDSTGIITIMTDGLENASEHYNLAQVKGLISYFRELGWTVNLIGANIDIDRMGDSLGIDNRLNWQPDAESTAEMYQKFRACLNGKLECYANEDMAMSVEERVKQRKKKAFGFFD